MWNVNVLHIHTTGEGEFWRTFAQTDIATLPVLLISVTALFLAGKRRAFNAAAHLTAVLVPPEETDKHGFTIKSHRQQLYFFRAAVNTERPWCEQFRRRTLVYEYRTRISSDLSSQPLFKVSVWNFTKDDCWIGHECQRAPTEGPAPSCQIRPMI